jgi:anti-anti-sigma factor
VARPPGDIDASNASTIGDSLAACLGPDADSLVLDLTTIGYLDSAGLDMLFRVSERLRQRRATLRLVVPAGSQLARLAAIVGLPEAIPVHDTVEEALSAETQTVNAPTSGQPH